ncbi:actin-binding LIM protein 1 isoform X33 [Anguilla rostrata]|uniref:actin-binding LIM protein 1 isoform X33 n=1 Tax=Anguilla rostrata TaxID=7938 RepID=UPI0030CE63E0
MPSVPHLNALGKLCGSIRSEEMVLDRVKRKNSVRRMSIIEDGHVAEVLYLIPKQSIMQQLPFLNPEDYYLCERLVGIPTDLGQVAHAQDAHPPTEKPVIQCCKCGEPCRGEVLRVQSRHFHIKCFTCKVCGCDLAQGGFFMKNGDYLCTLDYQRMHGTRCNGCGDFVEGEVVTALGKTYHPTCFVCTLCKRPFPAGDRVTFNGKDCLCQRCVQPMSPSPKDITSSSNCAGCGRDIKNGQALLALERQWHLGCFKCKTCGKVLTGEYISKDGSPYCEKDYQIHFGVQCEACHQYITGKVLEAGDKHYHPSCARCSRCNQMFTEGEEMYLQGSTVWHPDCKDNTRAEERHRFIPPSIANIHKTERQPTRSSSESICSRPGSSIPGSPGHTIYSPRTLSPTPSAEGCYDPRDRIIQRSTSQGSIGSPVYNRHSYTPTLSRSPQHFHRPEPLTGMQKLCSSLRGGPAHNDSRPTSPFRHHFMPHNKDSFYLGNEPSSGRNSPLLSRSDSRPVTPTLSLNPKHFHLPDQGTNIYRKPPIYKQHDSAAMAAQSKSADDIIKSAKFPAAYAPGPDQTPKIETDYWPCPPSLAALGSDGRRRSREEEEEELQKRRQLQEEHLNKIQSGLGKLILKEEMERELNRERYTRSVSAQRCDPQYTNCTADPSSPSSKTSSLPGYGRNGLHRPQSTDFTQYNSYGDVCGGGREFKVSS